MICSHCQKPNRDDRRFCGGCGRGLTLTCTGCSFVNDATDRFCGGCGCGLAAAATVVPAMSTVPMLSIAELESLLAERAEATAPIVGLPQGPIGQDDLDRLFGGAE